MSSRPCDAVHHCAGQYTCDRHEPSPVQYELVNGTWTLKGSLMSRSTSPDARNAGTMQTHAMKWGHTEMREPLVRCPLVPHTLPSLYTQTCTHSTLSSTVIPIAMERRSASVPRVALAYLAPSTQYKRALACAMPHRHHLPPQS